MVAELTALRDQIDEVDKALLSLLAKRLELVAEVGEVKSQYGLPIYVPERESAMLASRREEAAALGVPPDLIEDVLRRVMRESYSSENDKGFKTLCPSLRPVVIVGGAGQMGRLFEKMLTLSGYQVRILEKEDWAQAPELMKDAGMVSEEFKPAQIKVIYEAAEADLNLEHYMNPKFSASHMKFIMEQEKAGKDVTWLPIGKILHRSIVEKPLTRDQIKRIKERMLRAEPKESVLADLNEKKKETARVPKKQGPAKEKGER